jgi:hypothetical protein
MLRMGEGRNEAAMCEEEDEEPLAAQIRCRRGWVCGGGPWGVVVAGERPGKRRREEGRRVGGGTDPVPA